MYFLVYFCATKFYICTLRTQISDKLLHCKPTPNKSQSKSTNQEIYTYLYTTNQEIMLKCDQVHYFYLHQQPIL